MDGVGPFTFYSLIRACFDIINSEDLAQKSGTGGVVYHSINIMGSSAVFFAHFVNFNPFFKNSLLEGNPQSPKFVHNFYQKVESFALICL